MIPIQNLYYLLCYAWNTLDAAERLSVDTEQFRQLPDLFAKVLINGLRVLFKRGLDQSYQEQEQEVEGIKGKVQISATLKANRLWRQRTVCQYDEFSSDHAANQILAATVAHLLQVVTLDKSMKAELQQLLRMFPPQRRVALTPQVFQQVQLHRDQRLYHFLLHVCRIIADNLLPTETAGRCHFVDFRRDERKMNRVFESFLFRFYQKEQQEYWVRREQIRWQWEAPRDPQHLSYLPLMETDVTLESAQRKLILDAKYYRQPLGGSRFEVEKLLSGHLYQLYSYLSNQEHRDERARLATGILLYPQTDQPLRLDYRFGSHSILIRSVNLNTHWREIHQELLGVIE
jgi:5-methylcytosine-specific restriction enzyme subunit McrC